MRRLRVVRGCDAASGCFSAPEAVAPRSRTPDSRIPAPQTPAPPDRALPHPRYLSARHRSRRARNEITQVRPHRLAGRRDRLRDVGAGRLDRLRRRRSRSRRCSSRSSSAATSSTPPGRYGDGHSERLLGRARRATSRQARSTPRPRSRRRTCSGRRAAASRSTTVFPPDHIREYAEKSLANLGLPHIDLLQFHVWEDAWADDDRWQRAMDDLKREGLVRAVGVSVNRWEPGNVLRDAAHRPRRRGAGDLQHLRPGARGRAVPALPRAGRRRDRARPVRRGDAHRHADEGRRRWPEGDWRSTYFVPENLIPTRGARRRAQAARARRARRCPTWRCASSSRTPTSTS